MKTSEFDYDLPHELIAQTPVEPRDSSRLMVIDLASEGIEHRHFCNLPEYLKPGDVLVINESRVIPARLFGAREGSGGKIEALLLHPKTDRSWEALVKPGRRCPVGAKIRFGPDLTATVMAKTATGGRILEFAYDGDFNAVLEELGETPLPPYIKARLENKERYQTVYAKIKGSAAAPTAGLHFTTGLLDRIRAMGIAIVPLVLHVGWIRSGGPSRRYPGSRNALGVLLSDRRTCRGDQFVQRKRRPGDCRGHHRGAHPGNARPFGQSWSRIR